MDGNGKLPNIRRKGALRRTLPPCAATFFRPKREGKLFRNATLDQHLSSLMVQNRTSLEMLAKPEPVSRKLLPRLEKVASIAVAARIRSEAWTFVRKQLRKPGEVYTQCNNLDFPLSPTAELTLLEVETELKSLGI